jgi:hypothetical protein
LQSEAKKHDISLNVLVNQIIRQHLEWHLVASKIGEIPVQKSIISMLMEKIDDSDLIEIARISANQRFKNIVLMLNHEFTVSAWIGALKSWLDKTGFPYKHDRNKNQHLFIIHHDMGNKFSIFQKEIFETVFNMLEIKPKFELTNNITTFKFETDELN